MKTLDDLIVDLLHIGREDVVKALGVFYEKNYNGLQDKYKIGYHAHCTSALIDQCLVWSRTPQGSKYWGIVYEELSGQRL